MENKKILILLSILLTISCLFASCNANEQIFPQESIPSQDDDYLNDIQSLENKIIELQQNYQLSQEERQKEIERLQSLINQMKEESTTEPPANTETNNTETTPTPTGKFLYDVDPSNAEFAIITGYTGTEDRIVIPSVIDGYTVREIADSAFSSKDVKNIIITNGITKIGWFCFQSCTSLVSVTLPNSIESIGYSAFPTQNKNFTLYCSSNSFTQKYAQSYGIPYTII